MLIFTAALVALTVGGCETSDPPVSDETVGLPTFAERLVGRYTADFDESGETLLEIYLIDGTLIAEAEQEYAAYFAAELVPDEPSVLSDTEVLEAGFTAYAFSGFSSNGEYWDETPHISLALTPSGITLTESDGSQTQFLRDDSALPIHDPDIYAEQFPSAVDMAYPEALIGGWSAEVWDGHRITLSLSADGTFLWYRKTEGEPVAIFIGCGEVDAESGLLTVIAEQVGWANMPRMYTFYYYLTENGILMLKNGDTDGLIPLEDEIAMTGESE